MARVFISYSHQDEAWKDQIVSQLGVLAGVGLETWDDRRIAGGGDWQPEIERAIADCDVALLLISRHFLTSKFILGNEVPALLQRREQEGVRVIPVILAPCQWIRIGWLKTIQARPRDGKALTGMSEHDAEDALSTLAGEVHDLASPATAAPSPQLSPVGRGSPSPSIDLTHLPDPGVRHFLGREAELAALDEAWASGGRTSVLQLIAPGGVGKSSLALRWLDKLKAEHWRGAEAIFGWSFYSQGSGDDRQASEEGFIDAALTFYGINISTSASPWDKGAALAKVVAARRSLLILDGLEPLQYPPMSHVLAGELKAPGLQTLLQTLARQGQPGLVLITSRERLADLDGWVRDDERPEAGVALRDLGNLSDADGARLLWRLGVRKIGAFAVGGAEQAALDPECQVANRDVQGHALTLSLLGTYLAKAKAGDLLRRTEVDLGRANDEGKGHAFHVIKAYETWFKREGADSELAALSLAGFFDRPASRENLAALTAAPAIPGLTEALMGLSGDDWNLTLQPSGSRPDPP